LTTELNILLSYITGISAGAGIYLAGEDHSSRETVAVVKALLKEEIAEAEKRYKNIFTGKRYQDSFFRYLNPQSPPRSEY
jgi:hypothetical protein